MKKIAIIGLGIIGGSLCAALTKAGYAVDGTDCNKETVSEAIRLGYIQGEANNISLYDTVFIAVPPKATIDILCNETFKEGALVSDICGVKSNIVKAVYSQKRNYRYVSLHPMAGKETSGISSASPTMFNRANLIIINEPQTDALSVEEMKIYAKAMLFGRIVECTAKEHDEKIALTSQLAHIVSNAYVKSPRVDGCQGFTGGSFQDMTRIAGVDESVWTDLYMQNLPFVLEELNGLILHLEEYRTALKNADAAALSKALKEGRLCREKIKKDR